ncbi:ATP-dependent DNA helicase RecG [Actinospica durhamensis]|uniref:ATP-dependent DNA helicase RecG n=1 Tax=Actinospica durhamensis TaxID=1508375 RepID=A0A941EI82_9ACTN|nr:ATP-dependent DNA helicase RecG [Actinospica durhamensis]MBR7833045.1 ATP-dependent DNA helicase RecG [Actinospica durhamensis]
MSVAETGAADPLDHPLVEVLGDRTAKVLAKELGLRTFGDLLRYYPRRYYERGDFSDLTRLQPDEEITVQAEVAKVTKHPGPGRRPPRVEVEITDGKGTLQLTFFHSWLAERELRPGTSGLFAGKVGSFRGRPQIVHPEYHLYDEDEDGSKAAEEFAKPRPVYPATAKLRTWTIQRCVRVVLDSLPELEDPLPAEVRRRFNLLDLRTALLRVHRPDDLAETLVAKERLKWDEALPLQVVLAQRRLASQAEAATAREPRAGGLLERFDERLPFTLTAGQRTVCTEIERDLARPHPMHRLLQGEVGSGKTVVALRAMLTVVDSGGQAVLLAPTEVLAQQHHRSITQMLGPLARPGQLDGDPEGTKVALLTGSQGAKERRANLLDAACGDAGIVVGTHAVIQEHVQFQELGLVVVDEQHRFGVEQRDALRAKGSVPPHLLVMTATPIPRTVAMTVFGDLETSVLAELPGGRAPIQTHVVPALEKPNFFTRAWERIREEVAKGHQAYVVCPRIGGEAGDEADSDGSDAPETEPIEAESERRPPLAVVDVAAELEAGALAGLRIGVLHGRLTPAEKDEVMSAFTEGSLDVLVATTVVEVGVNVPNASVMVILDADRFGVSQLHQLRGRVGRGSAPGLCLLVTEAYADTPARERLDAVAGTLDGFELSRIDLEQRREGDVLGAAQSGRRSSLRLLSVLRDEELIGLARQAATELVAQDAPLERHPGLRAAVDALQHSDRAGFLAMT